MQTAVFISRTQANRAKRIQSNCSLRNAKGKTHLVDSGYAFPNGIVSCRTMERSCMLRKASGIVSGCTMSTAPGKTSNQRLFADLPNKDSAAGQIDNQTGRNVPRSSWQFYVATTVCASASAQPKATRSRATGRQLNDQQRSLWRS